MLGCWFGNLTATYQEHPSPLICLLPASSFFSLSRIDCFFVDLPDSPRQRAHLGFLALSALCTVDLHTCNAVWAWFASTTFAMFLRRKEADSHLALFLLC